jgi:hypothetical protein
MRAQGTDYSYVDVTSNGVTISVPRTDTDTIARILLAGAAKAPLATVTEPHRQNELVTGSIVIDEGPLAEEQSQDIASLIEDTLREEGFDSIS